MAHPLAAAQINLASRDARDSSLTRFRS